MSMRADKTQSSGSQGQPASGSGASHSMAGGHHRFDGPVRVEHRSSGTGAEPQFLCDAWALEFTVFGAILLLESSLEAGQELLINLAPQAASPERIAVTVISCESLVGSIRRMRVRFS